MSFEVTNVSCLFHVAVLNPAPQIVFLQWTVSSRGLTSGSVGILSSWALLSAFALSCCYFMLSIDNWHRLCHKPEEQQRQDGGKNKNVDVAVLHTPSVHKGVGILQEYFTFYIDRLQYWQHPRCRPVVVHSHCHLTFCVHTEFWDLLKAHWCLQ